MTRPSEALQPKRDAERVDYEDYHRRGKVVSMHDPAHPGEILKELVIEPLGLSVTAAAPHLGVRRKTLSKLISGRGDPLTMYIQ